MNLQQTMNKIFDGKIQVRYEYEHVDTNFGYRELGKRLYASTSPDWEDETFIRDYKYTKQIASIYWKVVNMYLLLDNIQWTFTEDEEEARKVMKKFCNNIVATHKEFVERIASQEEALLKMTYSLESSSEQRFNDTPDSEGNYNTDEYTTNITKIKNNVAQNPLQVYEARKATLENLYNEWMKKVLKGIIHYE